MSRVRRSRAFAVVAAGGILALAATGITLAATTTTGYLACSNAKHQLALLSSRGTCPAHYTKVTIGARGPAGPPGKQGLPGPNGVTNGYAAIASAGIQLSDTDIGPVLQLSLPAGKYIVSAKTVATSSASGNTGVGCVLKADTIGGLDDAANSTISSLGTSGGTATLALSDPLTITSTVTVELDCSGGNIMNAVTVTHTVITAIQLNNLTTTGS